MERSVKGISAAVEILAARRIRVIASTAREDREGDIIEVGGWDLAAFRRNPVVLFNHDPSKPIGRCVDIGVVSGRLEATVEFPPVGTSPLADEVHSLVRHGAVSALSVGFLPRETKPIPGGRGLRIMKAELLELSLVSVPANPDCLVVQREARGPEPKAAGVPTLRRSDAQRQLEALRRQGELMELRHAGLPISASAALRRADLEKLRKSGIKRKQL
jgi:Phage head maturation protease